MKLVVLERIHLLSILPKEGSFATLKIIRQLRENISFTEEENKLLNFQQTGGAVKWDIVGSVRVGKPDIAISDFQKEIIAKALESLSTQEKLQNEQFSLYEKFCLKEKTKPETPRK